jgi:Putative Actinobacterial Holin-X, holin superfamily III
VTKPVEVAPVTIGFVATSVVLEGKRTLMAHREPAVTEEPTIGKLVVDASRDVSDLIKSEIALAKSELRISVKAGGISIGLFAAAGFIVVLAIIMLSVAFAYFLSWTGLDLAWCFLIVFGVYLLLAGLLGFIGVRTIKKVKAPERAMEQAGRNKELLNRN